METDVPLNKIDAIYELREAVETKMRAEQALEEHASPAARDTLLAAVLDVEAKTQDAIEVCHECGHAADDGHRHPVRWPGDERDDNVVHVDFGRGVTGD